ncbi:MAG: sodium/substrate symporter small subunit, partial [Bacteroidota bacterium]
MVSRMPKVGYFHLNNYRIMKAKSKKKARNSTPQNRRLAYWKENLRYLFILLTIWFIVSYGF